MRTPVSRPSSRLALTLLTCMAATSLVSTPAVAKSVLVPQDTKDTEEDAGWRSKIPMGLGKYLGGKEPEKKEESALLPGASPQNAPQRASQNTMSSGAVRELPMMPRRMSLDESLALYKKAMQEQNRDLYHKPPRFTPEIDTSLNDDFTKNYPGTLPVTVPAQYMWGAAEVKKIKDVFGYEPKEIQENCQLRLTVSLKATKANGKKYIMAGHTEQIKYDGELGAIMITPKAVCRKPARGFPENSQSIGVLGSLYTSILNYGLPCPVPADSQGKTLTLQYQGDGKLNCVYK